MASDFLIQIQTIKKKHFFLGVVTFFPPITFILHVVLGFDD